MAAKVAIVVAIGRNGVRNTALGKDNKLLWHISDDLKRFNRLTMGHPIVMGRKTFESILGYTSGKPLPGRTNIVVTRDPNWSYEGVTVFHSFEEALEYAETLDDIEVHIGGGGELYRQALPHTDRLYLTIVDDDKEADSFFPDYQSEFTKKTFEEHHTDEKTGLRYTWINLERE